MSCFIVGKQTILDILSVLSLNVRFNNDLNKAQYYYSNLYNKLYKANIQAYKDRYNHNEEVVKDCVNMLSKEYILSDKDIKIILNKNFLLFNDDNMIQCLKSLQCFNYQYIDINKNIPKIDKIIQKTYSIIYFWLKEYLIKDYSLFNELKKEYIKDFSDCYWYRGKETYEYKEISKKLNSLEIDNIFNKSFKNGAFINLIDLCQYGSGYSKNQFMQNYINKVFKKHNKLDKLEYFRKQYDLSKWCYRD